MNRDVLTALPDIPYGGLGRDVALAVECDRTEHGPVFMIVQSRDEIGSSSSDPARSAACDHTWTAA